MSIGNLGAANGAQPAAGPLGAPIWSNVGTAAGSSPVGNAGNPSPTGGVSYFGASFESVMAAVSRGEVSLNQVIAAGSYFGGNNAAALQGNPTLMQAISQGPPQNGTNGLNGNAAGGGTVNGSYGSANLAPGTFGQSSQTNIVNPKLPMADVGVTAALLSPAQYGGN
jgi:hypothetical protein